MENRTSRRFKPNRGVVYTGKTQPLVGMQSLTRKLQRMYLLFKGVEGIHGLLSVLLQGWQKEGLRTSVMPNVKVSAVENPKFVTLR